MQVEKLAAGVGHTADFDDALLEAGFVTCEVIADQLAAPRAQEATRMAPRSTNTPSNVRRDAAYRTPLLDCLQTL